MSYSEQTNSNIDMYVCVCVCVLLLCYVVCYSIHFVYSITEKGYWFSAALI